MAANASPHPYWPDADMRRAVVPAKHEQGKEAIVIVKGAEVATLLITMDDVICGIEVEDQFRWRDIK